jgi:hypothetical protein
MHFGSFIWLQSGVENQSAGCRTSLGEDMKTHYICGERLYIDLAAGVASVRNRYFALVSKKRSYINRAQVRNGDAR